MPQAIDRVIEELKARTAIACSVLRHLSKTTGIADIFGRKSSWAIVGGVVRDTLISSDSAVLPLFPYWSDVDIATTRPPQAVERRANRTELKIGRNSFGGYKILDQTLGETDAWLVRMQSNQCDNVLHWRNYLDTIDFGLNAVAFIWPECRILIHPRWIADLSSAVVEKVADESPNRALQPFRAIALADKITRTLDRRIKFRYGPAIQDDFRWLVGKSGTEARIACFNYLEKKVASNRWRVSVLHRVRDDLKEITGETEFLSVFDRTFESLLTRWPAKLDSVSREMGMPLFKDSDDVIT